MDYNKLREWLSNLEHQQWEYWSKHIAKYLEEIREELLQENYIFAVTKITELIDGWKKNWIPYNKLKEEIKDMDRLWADKILDNVPFKCPVYQCGGLMVAKERPLPKGKEPDDYPDGRAGDEQLMDLICTNCSAVYGFLRFKDGN